MQDKPSHRHKWYPFSSKDKLMCDCNTVIDINTLLRNTAKTAAQAAKIELLVSQLYARDLKKYAHESAYAYVVAQGQSIVTHEQGALL